MRKVIIIKDDRGYTIAEESNYTYMYKEGAKAFARDKWGDENPLFVEPIKGENQ